MDFKRYLTRKELVQLYATFGIDDDKVFQKHSKRFWKTAAGLYLNPRVYEVNGAVLSI